MDNITIRAIEQRDNKALAKIIREGLAEFGANRPGTVYFDPTTDALYELFQTEGSFYYVAEQEGELLGGVGIFPTEGLPDETAELVKMYLAPAARGKGLGRRLIEHSIETASEKGYRNLYLESMPELRQALKVYEKFGFEYLQGPMGNSGHTGCSLWMLLKM
jgi:putative acetyltransferase